MTTTPKARPFPAQQDYSPAVRQYLNRLSAVEAANETQFATVIVRVNTLETTTTGLSSAVAGLQTRTTALEDEVSDTLADIAQLQTESASQATAIDLLNSRYDTARTDLDGALVAITTLDNRIDLAQLDIEAHTLAIDALQEDVTDLQQQEGGTAQALDAIDTRVTRVEAEMESAQTDIQVLQWTDDALQSRLAGTEARLADVVAALARQLLGLRLPVADAIAGTVPKVVGALWLPTGIYAPPMAYLGCPTTPAYTATFSLVTTVDGTELATVAVTGTMAWGTAAAGFTLESDTAVDLLLTGNHPAALAIIKGLVLNAGA